MKKLIETLALAFVAIAIVSVFNSCTKDEEDEGASCYTETYYGHISPKKLVNQDEKFATLEIVNY